jgi:hypothetical protein
MRYLRRSVVLALGLVIGSTSAANALNFCFNPGIPEPYPQSLAVAERFKNPTRGSCSAINGFDILSCPACEGPPLVVGTACLNSAGNTLRIAYTIQQAIVPSFGPTRPVYVTIDLPYPALLNGYAALNDTRNPGTTYGSQQGHANPCIPPVIPLS